MENSFFNKAHKELLDISTIRNNNLESSEFGLLHHFVFYFNCNLEKSAVDLYIENNFESLKKSFQSLRKTFVIVNNQTVSDSEIQTLQYYFPTLQVSNNHYNTSQSLLDYFNYTGTVQTGIIYQTYKSFKQEVSIIELKNPFIVANLDMFFASFFNRININDGFVFEDVEKSAEEISTEIINGGRKYSKEELIALANSGGALASPITFEYDEGEKIDNETKEQVELVLKKLNEIRDKGNFIALLPILEKQLQDQNNSTLSKLYIDQDYKIWLTDYNLEVKMSHLTKSIYFLFLAIEKGIDLYDLKGFKKQLTSIYLSVSNQENLDKMTKSIDLLLNDRNAIYVHISRIKATFLKLIREDLANKYYITGYKDKPKNIALERNLTNVDSLLFQ